MRKGLGFSYVIGFDPGISACGFSVLDLKKNKVIDHGVIEGNPALERLPRLFEVRQSVRAVLQGYSRILPRPDVAIEDFIFQKRTTKGGVDVPLRSAEMLNRIVQVIVSECWGLGFEPHLYPAPDVKEALAGFKRAGKEAIKKMVGFRVSSLPKNQHAIDATAVALYHADVCALLAAADTDELSRLMKKAPSSSWPSNS